MGYTGKPLEDLDLIDDFLLNEVTTNKEIAEPFCKTVLSVLLQKEIGKLRIVAQRTIPAPSPNMRGIRMDVEIEEYASNEEDKSKTNFQNAMPPANVYDLEAHLRDDMHLPKHNRFYQAKIDSRYLPAGERDFSKIPNLYVITITDYDPFGYDYMMYTMENHCKEVPQLQYDDGLQFIYFYTKGTKGGNTNIKTMLKYFNSSTLSNATTAETKELHKYLSKVKISQEAQIDYMKYDDLMYFAKKDGRTEGRAEGRTEGHAESVIELLEDIAPVPEEIRNTIMFQTDPNIIRIWLKSAAKAENLEDWKKRVNWSE